MTDAPPAPLYIPYEFDTRSHGRSILRAMTYMMIGLLLLIAVLLFTLHDPLFRLWVPVILGAFVLLKILAGLVVFRLAGGASGTLGKEHVTIEPDQFMGLATRTHRGTFLTTDYEAVELRRISLQGSVGILSLIPKDPTTAPRIVLGAMAYEEAKQHAAFLKKELGLTVQEPTS